MLELKVTIKYGDDPRASQPVKLGDGLVGYAALHKEVVLVPDVTTDPRYIAAIPGVRSELVVPLLLKDRCIGVFDLESPERDAFNKKHVKLLTLLASEAAVAIENARLYESIRTNEARLRKGAAAGAARADGAAAAGAAETPEGRGLWRGTSIRRASSAATSATSSLPNPTRSSSCSATCPARVCRRRSMARPSAR
jgi:GAF domain-containing protein